MIKFIIMFSFMLDGLLSIYQDVSFLGLQLFSPMFSVVAIVLIFPTYSKYHIVYYKACLLLGFFYDVLYTNTPFLNMLIFPLLGFLVYKLYTFLTDNILNSMIINIIILAIYNIITFLFLSLIGYLVFDISLLTTYILQVLLINTIYFFIVYLIINNAKHIKSPKSKYSL